MVWFPYDLMLLYASGESFGFSNRTAPVSTLGSVKVDEFIEVGDGGAFGAVEGNRRAGEKTGHQRLQEQ